MKFIFGFFFIFLLFSCSQNKKNEEGKKNTIIKKTTREDTLNFPLDTAAVQKAEKPLPTIENKYGKQWDFCDCIKKKDSINKLFLTDLSDKQLDEILGSSDIIDQKCKSVFDYNVSSPEERVIHQKKIDDCMVLKK